MEPIGAYRVLPKMRVPIPREIADKWGLKPKDKLIIYYDPENDRISIEKWRK